MFKYNGRDDELMCGCGVHIACARWEHGLQLHRPSQQRYQMDWQYANNCCTSLYTCLVTLDKFRKWSSNNWHSKCVTLGTHSTQSIGTFNTLVSFIVYPCLRTHLLQCIWEWVLIMLGVSSQCPQPRLPMAWVHSYRCACVIAHTKDL